jgi:3-hydroxyacyl-[acyl-carrier-protein] dehydratase
MSAMPASFAVAADHPCLAGHFPGNPLVPGVLILDRVVAAIEAQHGPLPAVRLPQVKFVQPLRPGETANVVLEPVPGAAPRWRFRVERDGSLLARGEVVAGADAEASR